MTGGLEFWNYKLVLGLFQFEPSFLMEVKGYKDAIDKL
jgi:hypothetical protein